MKNLIVLLSVLAFANVSAQITKNVGDFDELKVFDRISVELIPSTETKVVISGKRSDDVEVVNKNGQLRIKMNLEKLLKGETVEAKVYFTRLKHIDASEGSFIACGQAIKQKSIDITARAGGEIKLSLEVADVDVKSVTGGIVTLSGTADEMDASLGTGGILNAKELKTRETDVSINAGGEASVYATDEVDADVKAGGDIVIFGNPRNIDKSTTLGGTITESK